MYKWYICIFILSFFYQSCSNDKDEFIDKPIELPPVKLKSLKVNGLSSGFSYDKLNNSPEIEITFSADVDPNSVLDAVKLIDRNSTILRLSIV